MKIDRQGDFLPPSPPYIPFFSSNERLHFHYHVYVCMCVHIYVHINIIYRLLNLLFKSATMKNLVREDVIQFCKAR